MVRSVMGFMSVCCTCFQMCGVLFQAPCCEPCVAGGVFPPVLSRGRAELQVPSPAHTWGPTWGPAAHSACAKEVWAPARTDWPLQLHTNLFIIQMSNSDNSYNNNGNDFICVAPLHVDNKTARVHTTMLKHPNEQWRGLKIRNRHTYL